MKAFCKSNNNTKKQKTTKRFLLGESCGARTLWARLRLYSTVGPGVLVVSGGRIRAVVAVAFGRVVSCRAVDGRILVLVRVERFPVRGGARRAVAVRDPGGGCSGGGRAVVARIRSARLGQSGGFLRRMVHGGGELEGALEVGGFHTRDPPVEYSSHNSGKCARFCLSNGA